MKEQKRRAYQSLFETSKKWDVFTKGDYPKYIEKNPELSVLVDSIRAVEKKFQDLSIIDKKALLTVSLWRSYKHIQNLEARGDILNKKLGITGEILRDHRDHVRNNLQDELKLIGNYAYQARRINQIRDKFHKNTVTFESVKNRRAKIIDLYYQEKCLPEIQKRIRCGF